MKVVIIGGRGNGTVIASTIEDCMNAGQEIECAGFLNDEEKYINNYPVLGPINAISWQQLPDEFRFIYAMSNVKQASERYDLLSKLEIPEHKFANVIHPSAVVSTKATIGRGIVLMPFTLVGPDVVLGNHSQMFAQSFWMETHYLNHELPLQVDLSYAAIAACKTQEDTLRIHPKIKRWYYIYDRITLF